jgi:multiple sugar transport system substrate-binding protein
MNSHNAAAARRRPSRRRHLATLGLTAATLTGVCYPGAPAAQAATGNTPVTLSWQMWVGSQAEINAWDHDAAIVHKMYPWITVKLTFDPAWPGYWVKFPVEISSNTEPDLVAVQSLRTTGFQAGFMPLTMSDLVSDGIPGFSLSAYNQGIINGLKSSSGQQLALPYDFGPILVFYNKTVFLKYHIPLPANNWTWAQFYKDAATITKDSDGAIYGYADDPYIDEFLDYATDMLGGVRYLTSSGQLKINTPEFAKLLAQYVAPVKEGFAPLPPSNAIAGSWAEQQWEAGAAAIYLDGPWDMINNIAAVKAGIEKFQIGIAPLPAGPSGKSVSLLAGSGFGISKDLFKNHPHMNRAELLSDAVKAIEGLTSPQAEQFLSSEGRAFSARTAEQRYWFQTVASQGVPNAVSAMDYQLKYSVAYVTTNKWNGTSNAFNSQIIGVMQGSISPMAALNYTQDNQGAPAA